jgi:hypothetical protein
MYALVMEHVDVLTQCFDEDALATLCAASSEAPELVLYTGSGEIGVLTQPSLSAWMNASRLRYPKARHAFVTIGCTGWYAGILEFARSQARRAHIVTLETPRSYTQSRLDAAGIGTGGDGLIAKESVALTVLVRKRLDELQPSDTVVIACTILAKPVGLSGTEALLLKLRAWLIAKSPNDKTLDWVSFAIASRWSDQLMRGFERWVFPYVPIAETLPSLETDSHHWLSAKPVLEYAHYRGRLAGRNLAVNCLGAGGRLGVAILGLAASVASNRLESNIHIYPMGKVTWRSDLRLIEPEKPLYCSEDYRFRDNAYLIWELDFLLRQHASQHT